MRVLCDNIFNNNDWTTSSSDDFFPIENIFDYHTWNIGRFNNKTLGTLTVLSKSEGSETINSFAIFNTNAHLVKIEISNSDETRIYSIGISNKQAIYNISPIKFSECKITFYGNENNENNLEIGYLIIGEAVDFPPHDKAKTHTINYTHSQYFSVLCPFANTIFGKCLFLISLTRIKKKWKSFLTIAIFILSYCKFGKNQTHHAGRRH